MFEWRTWRLTGEAPLMSAPSSPTPFIPAEPKAGTPHKWLWSVLLLGWLASYADRTLTGPVVTWMIQNHVGFIGQSSAPNALGGLGGSLLIAVIAWVFFHRKLGGRLKLGRPVPNLIAVSLPLLAAVVVLFIISDELRWPTWGTAIGSGVLALIVIGVIVARLWRSPDRASLLGRDIVIIYVAFIAVLWNLWFFNYWAVAIIQEATKSTPLAAGLATR